MSPLVYLLNHGAGLFSEVNNLLNALLYERLTGRRLVVDERGFEAGPWSRRFESPPLPAPLPFDRLRPQWHIGRIKRSWNFREVRAAVELAFEHNPQGIFEHKRSLAMTYCRPSAPTRTAADAVLRSMDARFVAVHVRRGDKVIGTVRNGIRHAEGEDISVATYLAEIDRLAPTLPLFVMTDDISVVESFRSAGSRRVVSLCGPGRRGYDQAAVNNLSRDGRGNEADAAILDVEVASHSAVFVGSYLSNVSRYVALIHDQPEMCLSVDSQREWHPM